VSAELILSVPDVLEDRVSASRLLVDVVLEASCGNRLSEKSFDTLAERHQPKRSALSFEDLYQRLADGASPRQSSSRTPWRWDATIRTGPDRELETPL
jgi:hypothetical protein